MGPDGNLFPLGLMCNAQTDWLGMYIAQNIIMYILHTYSMVQDII